MSYLFLPILASVVSCFKNLNYDNRKTKIKKIRLAVAERSRNKPNLYKLIYRQACFHDSKEIDGPMLVISAHGHYLFPRAINHWAAASGSHPSRNSQRSVGP